MMKKIILMAGLLITSLAQAQDITVFNGDVEITEGYVFTSTSLDADNPDKLDIHVKNISTEDIRLKLKMVSLQNADGNEFFIQFCFGGNCYFSVEEGTTVGPVNSNGLVLAPNEENSEDDHFFSVYPGDTNTEDVIYNIAVIEVDIDGNQIGEPLRNFSYKYSPFASVNDLNGLKNIGIAINNTVVSKTLNVNANLNAKLELFDITGKQLKTVAITNGSQSVDLSGLNAAVYIARFTTEENKTSQVRIVKN